MSFRRFLRAELPSVPGVDKGYSVTLLFSVIFKKYLLPWRDGEECCFSHCWYGPEPSSLSPQSPSHPPSGTPSRGSSRACFAHANQFSRRVCFVVKNSRLSLLCSTSFFGFPDMFRQNLTPRWGGKGRERLAPAFPGCPAASPRGLLRNTTRKTNYQSPSRVRMLRITTKSELSLKWCRSIRMGTSRAGCPPSSCSWSRVK